MTAEELDRLAAGALDDYDDQLLARLARVGDRLDPVPDGLVERITFALSLAELEAEVAALQELDLAGARGEPDEHVRTVTFTSDTLTTMITVTATGADRVRVDGWLAPADAARVELRQGERSWDAAPDGDGRFVFADVPSGLTQFVVHRAGRPPVISPVTRL